jgi:DNA (cytosine-5)-methyltransferase 1
MTLTHGSLFTGVGGFDLGADAAGLETVWQCEINKQARSILAKHWPNVVRYEDVTEFKGDQVKPVDIISFGSPCQDLSIAGKGVGLAGERSGLFHQAIRIAKEMRDATNGEQPRFLIWENVRIANNNAIVKKF